MKKKRHEEILNIISTHEVENQETLCALLAERGYIVTQATVSRDINELRLEKMLSENGVSCYMKPRSANGARFRSIFGQSVVNIDCAGNIVCVKCHSGLASAACATIDAMDIGNVVGTIAGDDTLFILARTEDDANKLCRYLKNIN